MTGQDDLRKVTELEVTVNTSEQSVAQLGELCPNLLRLTLSNSYLATVRDLGVAVRNLRVLSLRGCGVQDLDGIGVLDRLTELHLAFNSVEDVTPLSLHEHLEVCLPPSLPSPPLPSSG